MSDEEKRKTRTSTAVKNRYNQKVYDQLALKLPKELVTAFKARCAEIGVPQAQVIRKAIEDFLRETAKEE